MSSNQSLLSKIAINCQIIRQTCHILPNRIKNFNFLFILWCKYYLKIYGNFDNKYFPHNEYYTENLYNNFLFKTLFEYF